MNEYSINLLIESDEDEKVEPFNLNEKNKKEWKEDMEAIALSEYYKRKIMISEQKIWFQKAALLKLMHRINSCRFFGGGG